MRWLQTLVLFAVAAVVVAIVVSEQGPRQFGAGGFR